MGEGWCEGTFFSILKLLVMSSLVFVANVCVVSFVVDVDVCWGYCLLLMFVVDVGMFLLMLLLLLYIMCIIPSLSPAVWGQSSAVQSPANQDSHSLPLLPFGEPDKGGRGQVMNIVRRTQKGQWNRGPHCANNHVLHIHTYFNM